MSEAQLSTQPCLTLTELLHCRMRELPVIESQLCIKCFKNNNDVFHLLNMCSVSRTMLVLGVGMEKHLTFIEYLRYARLHSHDLTLMISIYSYCYSKDRQYHCPHFTDEKAKAHKPVKQTKTCLRPHTSVVCRAPSHFSYLIFPGDL